MSFSKFDGKFFTIASECVFRCKDTTVNLSQDHQSRSVNLFRTTPGKFFFKNIDSGKK